MLRALQADDLVASEVATVTVAVLKAAILEWRRSNPHISDYLPDYLRLTGPKQRQLIDRLCPIGFVPLPSKHLDFARFMNNRVPETPTLPHLWSQTCPPPYPEVHFGPNEPQMEPEGLFYSLLPRKNGLHFAYAGDC